MYLQLKCKYQSFKFFVISFFNKGKLIVMGLPFLLFCGF